MGKHQDLTGKRFGQLVVIKRVENSKNGHKRYLCQCDCGKMDIKFSLNLLRGTYRCYDCSRKKIVIQTHHKSNTRLYNIYYSMKRRCYNLNNPAYKNYGGRVITICDEWLNKENGFMSFYNWAMDNGYQENLTIDRIDVNGNYEPNNCRWTTMEEQGNNRRNNHIIEYKGKKYTLSQLSENLKIKTSTLNWRLRNNWKEEDLDLNANPNNKYLRAK